MLLLKRMYSHIWNVNEAFGLSKRMIGDLHCLFKSLPSSPSPIRRTALLSCASECLGVEPQHGELRHNHLNHVRSPTENRPLRMVFALLLPSFTIFFNSRVNIRTFLNNNILFDNIGDLVPPVSLFWYRQFTLSDFSYRLSGTAPDTVHWHGGSAACVADEWYRLPGGFATMPNRSLLSRQKSCIDAYIREYR